MIACGSAVGVGARCAKGTSRFSPSRVNWEEPLLWHLLTVVLHPPGVRARTALVGSRTALLGHGPAARLASAVVGGGAPDVSPAVVRAWEPPRPSSRPRAGWCLLRTNPPHTHTHHTHTHARARARTLQRYGLNDGAGSDGGEYSDDVESCVSDRASARRRTAWDLPGGDGDGGDRRGVELGVPEPTPVANVVRAAPRSATGQGGGAPTDPLRRSGVTGDPRPCGGGDGGASVTGAHAPPGPSTPSRGQDNEVGEGGEGGGGLGPGELAVRVGRASEEQGFGFAFGTTDDGDRVVVGAAAPAVCVDNGMRLF